MLKKYLLYFITIYILLGMIFIDKVFADELWTDYTIIQDTEIEGEIYIKGLLSIKSGVTVTIKPGTIIKFVKLDTDGDDIGESGIYIQGTLIARGESENPIIFTSASSSPQKGDWDNIFFIVSDGKRNIIENCRVEYAYRGIHTHFSVLEVKNNKLSNNMRAMQFQESEIIAKKNIFIYNNSAMRFRDSKVKIFNNVFQDNYSAINFLRSEVEIKENTIERNILESLHARESNGIIENNRIINNRQGVYIKDSSLTFRKNTINSNIENGISVKYCSTTIIEKNLIEWNGGHGISIENSQLSIYYNNIMFNGKYNIYLKGEKDVNAKYNWWGEIDRSYIKSKIYDSSYDSSLKKVIFKPFLKASAFSDTTLLSGNITEEKEDNE